MVKDLVILYFSFSKFSNLTVVYGYADNKYWFKKYGVLFVVAVTVNCAALRS